MDTKKQGTIGMDVLRVVHGIKSVYTQVYPASKQSLGQEQISANLVKISKEMVENSGLDV